MAKFIDDIGAERHAMTVNELNELYRRLDDFLADCTVDEAEENKDAFIKIKTLLHKRMRI